MTRAGGSGIRPYIALAVGMLAVSSSAILISLARREGVPAIAIAALRMAFSAAGLLPFVLTRGRAELFRLSARDLALAAVSGALLALHFAFWISSLDYTSVMSSVVLVSANPLFVALASVLVLREPLGRWTGLGIAVAIVGGALVGLSDLGQAGGSSLKGDALALLGAAAASGYLLIGRRLRQRMSLLPYVGVAYSTAAVVLLVMAAASGTPLRGYSLAGYALVGLLAAGPQLIGHTSYNWALKHVSAVFVTVTLLAEPIGATLLAIPLLAEVPSPVRLAGGVVILAGIWLAARGEKGKTF
jgi:drug/metabolite transporter (DMT)-like permease